MLRKGEIVARFEKDGDHDMRGGPVQNRRCTDLLCLLLFVSHAVVFYTVAGLAVGNGDLRKIYYPRDYRGEYCGLDAQWRGARDLDGYPRLALTVSVSEAMDAVALALLCSYSGRGLLDGAESVSQACGSLGSSTASSLQSRVDAVSAAGLLGFDGLPSALPDVSRYFNTVCAADCRLNASQASREYIYSPAPDTPWAPAWESYRVRIEASGNTELQRALARLRFSAWSYEACPYPAKYCVAFPGVEYFEGPNGVCLMRPNSTTAQQIGAGFSGFLRDASYLEIASGTAGLSALAGHSDTYFLVAVISIVAALILMVLIRFCAKPVVVSVIVLFSLLLVLGGVASLVRAGQCADTGFLGSLDSIASVAEDSVTSAFEAPGLQTDALDCASRGGYAVESGTERDILKVCGFALCVLALVWAALIACLWKRIQLAIAASEVAAMFVFHTPQILLVPLAQILLGIGWTFTWCVLAGILLTSIPADQIPAEAYPTRAEAMGTDETPGACTRDWPPGFAWEDELGCGSNSTLQCWRCAPPRFLLDYRFAYAVFSLLWHNALLIAVGQCIIAGATAVWFFTPRSRKTTQATVLVSTWMALRFHLGSLAFGSLILACVQFLKLCMYYLSKQSQAHKNACAELIFKAIACCLQLFERCIKFLNKNAYIQVALRGTSFCTSAKNAFALLVRNCIRFGVLAGMGWCIRLTGSAFILAATGVAGYFALQAMYPEASPLVPVLIFLSIGYIVGKLTMNVFALALDTTLHCFIITEEMHHREGDFIPAALRKFLRDQDLKGESDRISCSGCAPPCCWSSRQIMTAPAEQGAS